MFITNPHSRRHQILTNETPLKTVACKVSSSQYKNEEPSISEYQLNRAFILGERAVKDA